LRFAGKGGASYLEGDVARLMVEAANQSEDMLHIDGEITDVASIMGGAVHLDGTHEYNAGVQLCVGKSGVLTVNKSIDLTTNTLEVLVSDGELLMYAGLDTLRMSGGSVCLYNDDAGNGAGIATALYGSGSGRLFWQSNGNIGNAYMRGSSILDGNTWDMTRTLTYAEMHDDARIMLKKNSLLTLTTGIRAFGAHSPALPATKLITVT
jgi:hypothetical protein